MRSAAYRGKELLPAEHALELGLALGLVELLDPRVRRIAGHLLDPEVPVGDGRDLRQVRDRDHLRPLGKPLEDPADRVCRLAADTRVDLVEDERLAAGDHGDRQGDPRELAAGGGLRDGREREARVWPDEEDRLVGTRGAEVAFLELADE